MEIHNQYSNIQFASKCNPIKPFKFTTKAGELRVFEPSAEEVKTPEFAQKIVDFFFNNFTKDTNDPAWLRFQRKENESLFKKFKKDYAEEVHQLIMEDDGHTTFLVAKDLDDNIRGAIMTHGLDEIPLMKKIVMYVANIATDSEFRHSGLGKILMEKAMEADKTHFTDVFLVGENCAKGFYDKLGFKSLDKNDLSQKKIMNYMKSMRFDYPDYVTLFTKPLQENRQRWYDVVAPILSSMKI